MARSNLLGGCSNVSGVDRAEFAFVGFPTANVVAEPLGDLIASVPIQELRLEKSSELAPDFSLLNGPGDGERSEVVRDSAVVTNDRDVRDERKGWIRPAMENCWWELAESTEAAGFAFPALINATFD